MSSRAHRDKLGAKMKTSTWKRVRTMKETFLFFLIHKLYMSCCRVISSKAGCLLWTVEMPNLKISLCFSVFVERP